MHVWTLDCLPVFESTLAIVRCLLSVSILLFNFFAWFTATNPLPLYLALDFCVLTVDLCLGWSFSGPWCHLWSSQQHLGEHWEHSAEADEAECKKMYIYSIWQRPSRVTCLRPVAAAWKSRDLNSKPSNQSANTLSTELLLPPKNSLICFKTVNMQYKVKKILVTFRYFQ